MARKKPIRRASRTGAGKAGSTTRTKGSAKKSARRSRTAQPAARTRKAAKASKAGTTTRKAGKKATKKATKSKATKATRAKALGPSAKRTKKNTKTPKAKATEKSTSRKRPTSGAARTGAGVRVTAGGAASNTRQLRAPRPAPHGGGSHRPVPIPRPVRSPRPPGPRAGRRREPFAFQLDDTPRPEVDALLARVYRYAAIELREQEMRVRTSDPDAGDERADTYARAREYLMQALVRWEQKERGS